MPGAEDNKEVSKNGQTGADDEKEGTAPAGTQTGSEGNGGETNEDFSDPAKALAEIKKLRAENAKHRTKNKALDEQMSALNGKFDSLKKALGGEEDEEEPATKVQRLQSENQALAMEISVSQIAREHNIPAAQDKYFRFLLADKMEALEEGEELTDETIAEVAAEVLKVGGSGKPNSTGLNGQQKPALNGGNATLSVEAFAKMNTGEKSELYAKNPSEYNRLFSEAKDKRLL